MVKNKFENNRSTDRLKLLFFQFAPVIIDTKIRSFDAQLHCKWVTKPFFSTSFLTSFRQLLVMWHFSLYLSYLSYLFAGIVQIVQMYDLAKSNFNQKFNQVLYVNFEILSKIFPGSLDYESFLFMFSFFIVMKCIVTEYPLPRDY